MIICLFVERVRPGSSWNVLLRPVGVGRDLGPASLRRRPPPRGRPGRRGGLRDAELLGVYGEGHLAVPSRILPLCNLQRSLDAVGLHRYAETSSAACYLDRDPHHFVPSLRPPVGLFWMCAFPLFATALSSPRDRKSTRLNSSHA